MSQNGSKEHDYTVRIWGHDFTFTPINKGLEGHMLGWGEGLQSGDYLILPNGSSETTRYQITSIEYYCDPPDMWKADVIFAPREAK